MKLNLSKFATSKYRWFALIFIALGLAIVVIDNTVLNVSIPYMLRDLHTNLDSLEWVISGYALTIATVLITAGRLGDLLGRKKLFLSGIIIFVLGSLIGSFAQVVTTIIVGRAIIQAVGAAVTLTSALSLVATEFQGKERAIAFGIWGSVAGAGATIGPLLGGYLTTYYSWRWSLRINVIVGIIALLGSVFIKESFGKGEKRFDWRGTIFSGLGLFSLIFAIIEGQRYGWFYPTQKVLTIFGYVWPLSRISIIPFTFLLSAIFLILFYLRETTLLKNGGTPLLRMNIFKNFGFSIGLILLAILTMGQFGTFFLMPIYLENVLGLNAFRAGLVFLWSSGALFLVGSSTGFIARKINIKWIVVAGLILLTTGNYFLRESISITSTSLSLAPALLVFGIGFGLGASQLNNIIISAAPLEIVGEASALSATMRQIGGSIGIALIGAIFASTLTGNIVSNISTDRAIPSPLKTQINSMIRNIDVSGGQVVPSGLEEIPQKVKSALKNDIDKGIVSAVKVSLTAGIGLIGLATLLSFWLPLVKEEGSEKREIASEE